MRLATTTRMTFARRIETLSFVPVVLGILIGCSSGSKGESSGGPGPSSTTPSPSGISPDAPDAAPPPSELDVSLVRDIATRTASSSATGFIPYDGHVIFAARGNANWMLLETDGTTAGTHTIANLPVDVDTVLPLAAFAGKIFFSARDDSHGDELWSLDPESGATSLFFDASPGEFSSSPRWITTMGAKAFFTATVGENRLLFTSDGTSAGTHLVSIDPINDDEVAIMGSRIYFASAHAAPDGNGEELWATDGTDAGTVSIMDIRPGEVGSQPTMIGVVGSLLLFYADDGVHGAELWKTDGTTAGTSLVLDIDPGSAPSSFGFGLPTPAAVMGGSAYFLAQNATSGYEIWKSNGTAAGTVLVKDIAPGSASSTPLAFVTSGSRVFFVASDGTHGRELWSTDGTSANTTMAADIHVGAADTAITAIVPRAVGGVVLVADDGVHGAEPWRSDGTPAGTVIVSDFCAGACASNPSPLVAAGNTFYFGAANATTDGVPVATDATLSGTRVLAPDLQTATASSSPKNIVVARTHAFFEADDGVGGTQLWATDGTTVGTTKLTSGVSASLHGGVYGSITIVGETAYFEGYDATHGNELWKSDGTVAGTVMVKDIAPAGDSLGGLTAAVLGNEIFFCANDGTHGSELWKSDGTAAGTVMMIDENAGAANGCNTIFPNAVLGGSIFYQGQDGQYGAAFVTDGNTVTRIGDEGLLVQSYVESGSEMFFVGVGALFGPPVKPGLYRTTGTLAGTSFVMSSSPATTLSLGPDLLLGDVDEVSAWDGSSPLAIASVGVVGNFFGLGSNALWIGGNATDGYGAWTTDGTIDGTRLLVALEPSSIVPSFATIANRAYFPGQNEDYGNELWSTDGTDADTHIAADVRPGPASSNPTGLISFHDGFLFAADDGTHGSELMFARRKTP